MDETSTNLNLPFLQAAQAQKHVTHNAALERLDVVVHLVLQSFAETTPPPSPAEGQVWAIGAAPVDGWAGHAGALAAWSNNGWLFVTPRAGWCAARGAELRIWDGTAWVAPDLPPLQDLPGVGIGTGYDATNRLAVKSAASLFDNQGQGHQLKINKAATGDTAALLFQTGFSGRAEIGTLGDDRFAVTVSADGSAWQTALDISPATGLTSVLGLAPGTPLTSPVIGGTLGGSAAQKLGFLRCTTGGTANALALTYGLPGLVAGVAVRFRASAANTGATTLNLDGTGAVGCVTVRGTALPAGFIRTDADTLAWYDGTVWVVDRAVERGSNANGSYMRLADGTQICGTVIAGLEITTAADSIFRSNSTNWSFPAAFSVTPAVFASLSIIDTRWPSCRAVNTTTGQARQYRTASTTTLADYQFLALGQWY